MDRALHRRVTWGEAAEALMEGVTEGLNLRLVAGAPTQEERDLARELRAEEQATHAWSG